MKEFKYKINGSPYKVVVQKSDSESVELEVNGTPYIVEVEQKTKQTISKIQRPVSAPAYSAAVGTQPKPAATPTVAAPGTTVIYSPLPGVALDIKAKEGDVVKKGQTLLVLEAMKMENNIDSPVDGTISKISVDKGASVLEGTELIIIK